MKRRPDSNLTVDVIAAKIWLRRVRNVAALARMAAVAALEGSRKKVGKAELAVVFTTDAAARKLNAVYRGQNKPTNVLSFAAGEADLLGDVILAYGVVAKEARSDAKPLKNHILHLVVHGVLHLLGYDHGRAFDAKAMEALETKILAGLGVPDPYAAVAMTPPARKRRAKRAKSRGARP
jgi:probable rRNA maturation factor